MLLDLDDDIPTRDELASRFFADAARAVRIDAIVEEPAPERVRFESPAFRERQRYLMRYVAGAVAAAGAICLAAFVRTTTAADAMASDRPMPLAAAAMAPAAPAMPESVPDAPAAPLRENAVAAESAPVNVPAVPAVAASSRESAPPAQRSAHEEKQLAIAALDHGNWGAAIAAGERSVRLDPADGQAWLILGGAYQQRGAEGQARRCYASCARLARASGSRAECVALAR
jgi:Flp pilus assembly protein TadD